MLVRRTSGGQNSLRTSCDTKDLSHKAWLQYSQNNLDAETGQNCEKHLLKMSVVLDEDGTHSGGTCEHKSLESQWADRTRDVPEIRRPLLLQKASF